MEAEPRQTISLSLVCAVTAAKDQTLAHLILKLGRSFRFTIRVPKPGMIIFRLDGAIIQPMTPEARVTVKIMQLNDEQRVEERKRLIALGLY